jgi:pimeloyl-ACP methyl ester carboxylesterase
MPANLCGKSPAHEFDTDKSGGQVATYVLIHGSQHSSWYWHRVVPRLEALGHEAIAVELPCDDESAGLAEYAQTVVKDVGDRHGVILVAHSLGGFTAPLVSEPLSASLIVLVAAMVPLPGESAGQWWTNTGHRMPEPFDPEVVFAHDLPQPVAAELPRHLRAQSGKPFGDPWPLDAWPDVPTRFLLCRGDRFFPADFLRRVVPERLGIVPDEMDGGHLPALARPDELVERLERFRTGD